MELLIEMILILAGAVVGFVFFVIFMLLLSSIFKSSNSQGEGWDEDGNFKP